jgi:hypothetical protein
MNKAVCLIYLIEMLIIIKILHSGNFNFQKKVLTKDFVLSHLKHIARFINFLTTVMGWEWGGSPKTILEKVEKHRF